MFPMQINKIILYSYESNKIPFGVYVNIVANSTGVHNFKF